MDAAWMPVITAIVTGLLSLVGVYIANRKSASLIEYRLQQLEEKVEALSAEIEANAADYVKVAALMAEQEETQRKLDEATERWLFLQEKWEQIQAQQNA